MSQGRIVDFSAKMQPAASMRIAVPAQNCDDDSQATRPSQSSALMLKILTMTREERIAVLSAGADDPVLILLAMLTSQERKELVRAAEIQLKATIQDAR